jgi:hypothetical protein
VVVLNSLVEKQKNPKKKGNYLPHLVNLMAIDTCQIHVAFLRTKLETSNKTGAPCPLALGIS